MVEAVDHYTFRDNAKDDQPLVLKTPPVDGSEVKPWWGKYWTDSQEEYLIIDAGLCATKSHRTFI